MKRIIIDDHEWDFLEEDADEGVGLPIKGYTFIEPRGSYALVDSNNRIWIQDPYDCPESPGCFESPCLKHCLIIIRQHPQSYELINKLMGL
jgi:hypothetical protein